MMQTIGVFVTEDTNALFHFHFSKCYLDGLITVYTDLQAFNTAKHNKKMACLQMPYPLNTEFAQLVDSLQSNCDQQLILVSELHDKTLEFMFAYDHARISYFVCGHLNAELYNSPVHKFYDWFTTTVHFYKFVRPELLGNALNPYGHKPRTVDALLGRKKLHRDLIFDNINKNSNVVSYLDSSTGITPEDFKDNTKWIWETYGMEVGQHVEWTVDKVRYFGHSLSLSQVVPIDVYNKTAYSVVAETNWNNLYSFYTEKTVKPILGRRLFLLASGQYALQNLRKLGFRTFENAIDESYDREVGLVERCKMITEQIRYLESQAQDDILEKIRPICEHNYGHMMRTDWYGEYFMPAFVEYFLQT